MVREKQLLMDRADFIKRCQAASVGENVQHNLLVEYKGVKYIPIEYVLWFDKGTPQHSVMLKDTATNSVIRAALDKLI